MFDTIGRERHRESVQRRAGSLGASLLLNGGLIGAMIGAATLTLLFKVLFSIGVLSFTTGIAQGLVMILAVLLGTQAARVAQLRRT